MLAKGGYNKIKIQGKNLSYDQLEIELLKDGQKLKPNLILQEEGQEEINLLLKIEENLENKDLNYQLRVSHKGQTIEKEFIQAKPGVDKEALGLEASFISIDEKLQTITVEYPRNIKNALESLEELKGEIGISHQLKTGPKGENKEDFISLGKEDQLEIRDNFLVISLEKPLEDLLHKKIQIKEGALVDSEGKYSHKLVSILKSEKNAQYQSLKLEKQIYDHKAGIVKANLEGRNLRQYQEDGHKKTGTLCKIREAGNSTPLDIECKVTGEGNKQEISFQLPENKGSRSKSYILTLSLDGGMTYIDQSSYSGDRGDLAVVTVLAEGMQEDQVTVSAMTIASYGTSSEDLKSTVCAINQESKKTQVGLYGTNLEKWKTKFKLVDEKGIEWPILCNPGHDSSDFPTMVLHWNGVIGEGNYQFVEIILPNNIGGEPEFTYYVAGDGKNFDPELTVKATVAKGLDGTPNRFRDQVVDLNIICQDPEGQSLKEVKKSGYHWFTYNLQTQEEIDQKRGDRLQGYLGDEIAYPEIEGYEIDLEATKKADLTGSYTEAGKTVKLIYKKVN